MGNTEKEVRTSIPHKTLSHKRCSKCPPSALIDASTRCRVVNPFLDPCSYNIISSSKCEECVLKFVTFLFVTTCIYSPLLAFPTKKWNYHHIFHYFIGGISGLWYSPTFAKHLSPPRWIISCIIFIHLSGFENLPVDCYY